MQKIVDSLLEKDYEKRPTINAILDMPEIKKEVRFLGTI